MRPRIHAVLALGYGQPPGGYAPPPPPPAAYSPPPQAAPSPFQPAPAAPHPAPGKKPVPILMIVGVLLLVVGLVVAVMGALPFMTAKKIGDLKGDYDSTSGKFRTHSVGEKIILTGKITEKNDTGGLLSMGKYAYMLDDADYGFFSDEDLGKVGDTVTVEVEVKEFKQSFMGISISVQYLGNGKPAMTLPLIIVGVVILVVGVAVMAIGMKKRKGAPAMAPPQAQMAPPPTYQQPPQAGYAPPPGPPAYQPPPPPPQQPGYAPPPGPPGYYPPPPRQ